MLIDSQHIKIHNINIYASEATSQFIVQVDRPYTTANTSHAEVEDNEIQNEQMLNANSYFIKTKISSKDAKLSDRKRGNETQQSISENNEQNSSTKAPADKKIDSQSHDTTQTNFDLITKKLSTKYQYHGRPGLGEDNFDGQSLSSVLRGKKHKDKTRRNGSDQK